MPQPMLRPSVFGSGINSSLPARGTLLSDVGRDNKLVDRLTHETDSDT